jgi:tRNA (guanine-N7-)-methyltransferase
MEHPTKARIEIALVPLDALSSTPARRAVKAGTIFRQFSQTVSLLVALVAGTSPQFGYRLPSFAIQRREDDHTRLFDSGSSKTYPDGEAVGSFMAVFVNPYIDRLHEVADVVLQGTPGDQLEIRIADHIARFDECFLEFGSGSGGHLIELAATNPNALCIGCELRYKRAFRTAEKAIGQGLSNLLVLRMDARTVPALFPTASVDRVYMNFPDPWEKLRWRKHRMASEPLFKSVSSLLKPDGVFRHKTDHGDLHHELMKILPSSGLTITKTSSDLYNSEWLPGNIPSEFERLFLSQGLPIFFLEAAKSPTP